MTSVPSNSASSPNVAVKPQAANETKQIVLKEIGVKWNKFSEQDLSALKNKDDLVTRLSPSTASRRFKLSATSIPC